MIIRMFIRALYFLKNEVGFFSSKQITVSDRPETWLAQKQKKNRKRIFLASGAIGCETIWYFYFWLSIISPTDIGYEIAFHWTIGCIHWRPCCRHLVSTSRHLLGSSALFTLNQAAARHPNEWDFRTLETCCLWSGGWVNDPHLIAHMMATSFSFVTGQEDILWWSETHFL